MKKIIAYLIILSFVLPLHVRAGIDMDMAPVEKDLIDKQKQTEKLRFEEEMSKEAQKKQSEADKKQLEEQMSRDMQKQADEQKAALASKEKKPDNSGSSWWKWGLGILVVGGIAAAAGGHGGSSSGGSSSGGSTVTGSW